MSDPTDSDAVDIVSVPCGVISPGPESVWPLPAPPVWAAPAAPNSVVSATDLTGGMPVEAMVLAVARLDVAAGLAAAVAVRHLLVCDLATPSTSSAPVTAGAGAPLWASDPALPCCALAASTPAHRASFIHVAHLHVDLLTTAINDLRLLRCHDRASKAAVDAAFDDVVAHAQALSSEVVEVLGEMARRNQGLTPERDLLYLVPFLALNVPVARTQVYERYGVPWPVALTWETHCPLDAQEAEALFAPIAAAVAASGQPQAARERTASLRVVR